MPEADSIIGRTAAMLRTLHLVRSPKLRWPWGRLLLFTWCVKLCEAWERSQ